jgi:hypothetical protein
MKRTPEQSATVAAWLNMLDHVEAQLQSLGALTPTRVQVRTLRAAIKKDAAKRVERTERAKRSREKVDRLSARVIQLEECNRVASIEAASLFSAKKHSEERRLELLALAQELGCDCVPQKMIEAVKALKEGKER